MEDDKLTADLLEVNDDMNNLFLRWDCNPLKTSFKSYHLEKFTMLLAMHDNIPQLVYHCDVCFDDSFHIPKNNSSIVHHDRHPFWVDMIVMRRTKARARPNKVQLRSLQPPLRWCKKSTYVNHDDFFTPFLSCQPPAARPTVTEAPLIDFSSPQVKMHWPNIVNSRKQD